MKKHRTLLRIAAADLLGLMDVLGVCHALSSVAIAARGVWHRTA